MRGKKIQFWIIIKSHFLLFYVIMVLAALGKTINEKQLKEEIDVVYISVVVFRQTDFLAHASISFTI